MYGNGINAPQGLNDSITLIGALLNGALQTYPIASGYATAIFTGDPIIGQADGTIGRAVAGQGNPIGGVCKGVSYVDTTGIQRYFPYWAAATVTQGAQTANAFVIDDPNVEFDIQVSGGGNTLTLAMINSNADLVINAGNTISGFSGAALDLTTVGANATKQLKIMRLSPVPGNNFGALFNNAIVKINNHVLNGGTGTAGI